MRILALILCALLPISAAAQSEDRSLLEAWLAEQLSTPQRQVQIDGFTGALSSRAQMRRLVIEDAQGPWLVADDLVLDWDRAALLGGALVVHELSAKSLHILRDPPSQGAADDTGFSLPDLPITIAIAKMRLDRVQIDADVFGHSVEGSMTGALSWGPETRLIDLSIARRDGVSGQIDVSLAQQGATAPITAQIDASEGKGGLIAHLLGLPNAPALQAKGDFSAAGDDLHGQLQVLGDAAPILTARLETIPSGGATPYQLQLKGDLRPLLPAQFHRALGQDTAASVTFGRRDGGGWTLPALRITLPWIQANGALSVDATGALQHLDLRASGGLPDLPDLIPSGVQFGQGDLQLKLADENADWQISARLQGLAFQGVGYDLITAQATAPRRGNGPAQLALQGAGARNEVLQRVLPAPQVTAKIANLLAWRSAQITLDLRDDDTITAADVAGVWSDGFQVSGLLAPGLLADRRPFGAIRLSGQLDRDGDSQISLQSHSGAVIDISGQVAADPDLTIRAAAPGTVLDPWLAPRRLRGTIAAQGALRGDWALDQLTITITGRALSLLDPDFGPVMQNAALDATVEQARLMAALRGDDGRLVADAVVDLSNGGHTVQLRLKNKPLSLAAYGTAEVSADLQLTGSPDAAPRLSGQITLGRTELRLPDQLGSTGPAPLAQVQHIGASADVIASLARAGLAPQAARQAPARPIQLDVTLDAPARVFLRGRGIDAEFSGALRLTGPVHAPDQQGQFDLLRGRMDLLGQRLNLTEGRLLFRGAALPQVTLQAQAARDGTQITIALSGPIDSPDITLSSVPDLPEAEALALLIFGTDAGRLSSLQALQLVAAIRSLSGKDIGITERLRRATGVDDFDVETDASGQSALRLGKYLGENLYTTLTLGAAGQTQIELNLDLNDNITAKTSIGSEGGQGVGLYYERDY